MEMTKAGRHAENGRGRMGRARQRGVFPGPAHSRSAPHRHREAGHCLHGGALTWVLGAGQSGCGCGQGRQEVAREMPNLNCMQSWDCQGHGEPGTPPWAFGTKTQHLSLMSPASYFGRGKDTPNCVADAMTFSI